MDQSTSREVVLKRINDALNTGVQNANVTGPNHSFDDLYDSGDEKTLNRFIESATESGVQVFHCSDAKEFKSHFRKIVEENGWNRLNCMDADLIKSLQLDSISINWTEDAMECEATITDCEFMTARTGTIVMTSSQIFGRSLPIHTPVHIVIGYEDQIVHDLPNAFDRIQMKYQDKYPSALYFASGVSSTGDIEKTLVRGVHGPEEVYIFLFKHKIIKR